MRRMRVLVVVLLAARIFRLELLFFFGLLLLLLALPGSLSACLVDYISSTPNNWRRRRNIIVRQMHDLSELCLAVVVKSWARVFRTKRGILPCAGGLKVIYPRTDGRTDRRTHVQTHTPAYGRPYVSRLSKAHSHGRRRRRGKNLHTYERT